MEGRSRCPRVPGAVFAGQEISNEPVRMMFLLLPSHRLRRGAGPARIEDALRVSAWRKSAVAFLTTEAAIAKRLTGEAKNPRSPDSF